MEFDGHYMVSVIIPAYNNAGLLPACLGALQTQAGLAFGVDYEVILVDDGSQDATVEVGRKFGARVISQPNAGPAAARNTGVRASCAPIVAFTDADCVPEPEWLQQMLAPFADPEVTG